MVILKELLFESYQNIFDEETKRKYANEVFELLQNAYSKIGGIKGSGFSSPEDMIQNIPFWKLFIYKGKVIACMMYKDKGGRKMVAIGSIRDKTNPLYDKSKEIVFTMMKDDVKTFRSYGEISGNVLKKYKSLIPNFFEEFCVPAETVSKYFTDIIPTGKYTYKRKIGNEYIEKVMYGKLPI